MSCGTAHWPSVVLMLLPTQYFVLQRGNPICKSSILIGTSQYPILVNLSKLLFCMMPQVSYTEDSQNTKYKWVLDGEEIFLTRL